MRLISTETLEFREFFDVDIPRYVILSHRWEKADSDLREIEFEEFTALSTAQRRALPKIGPFCSLAEAHRFKWAWVDTCCIDKRSSAELSEAINSMFRWYQRADRCYVYFNDVEWDEDDLELSRAKLRSSSWFTRGWTLQELLAPRFLYCYDVHWLQFGDRNSLSDDITAATGISEAHLKNRKNASVAMIMSWAANRETSRVEDLAYCLLGLFNINMPMLYGEGMNAFIRLQRKIIKKTDDDSIFSWTDPETFRPHGMLAPSPRAFSGCGDIIRTTNSMTMVRRPYSMTNMGLELCLKVPQGFHEHLSSEFASISLSLQCERSSISAGQPKYLAVSLKRIEGSWRRTECNQVCRLLKSPVTIFNGSVREDLSGGIDEAIYVAQEDLLT